MCLPKFWEACFFGGKIWGNGGRWVIFAVTNYTIIVRDSVV